MNGSEAWANANDTLRIVLVPGTIAFALWLFRRPIREVIRNIRKAEALGVSVELERTEVVFERSNLVLGETVPDVIAPDEDGDPKAITDGANDGDVESKALTGSAHLEGRVSVIAEADVARATGTVGDAHVVTNSRDAHDDLLERREQMEEIIRAAWNAGVEAGQTGPFAVPPEPKILWFGDKPRILGWDVVVRPGTIRSTAKVGTPTVVHGPSEKVRRLEDEVRRLLANGAAMGSRLGSPDYQLYVELRDKLRRLDPDSPLV